MVIPLWSELNKNEIDHERLGKDRWKYSSPSGGPLRFQIPRGLCKWGVSGYKSMNVEIQDENFLTWWHSLENLLSPQEPFNSNLKLNSLRLKIDDSVYIFDENGRQVTPDIQEGLFKGLYVTCGIEIESNYFFKEQWGLTVRVFQLKFYGTIDKEEEIERGKCHFL